MVECPVEGYRGISGCFHQQPHVLHVDRTVGTQTSEYKAVNAKSLGCLDVIDHFPDLAFRV